MTNKKAVYYAHHMWKYNTLKEKEELEIINNYYKNEAFIINPNTWIAQFLDQESAMLQCFHLIRTQCNELVFTTLLNGTIGKGVYDEIRMALETGIRVIYFEGTKAKDFTYCDYLSIEIIYDKTKSNREYARIK